MNASFLNADSRLAALYLSDAVARGLNAHRYADPMDECDAIHNSDDLSAPGAVPYCGNIPDDTKLESLGIDLVTLERELGKGVLTTSLFAGALYWDVLNIEQFNNLPATSKNLAFYNRLRLFVAGAEAGIDWVTLDRELEKGVLTQSLFARALNCGLLEPEVFNNLPNTPDNAAYYEELETELDGYDRVMMMFGEAL